MKKILPGKTYNYTMPECTRRDGIERRVNDIKWCVAVDEDCSPTTGIAHLMYLCDNWDCCDLELRSRHPRCGQIFTVGWMHDTATHDPQHCKKCEHNDRRSGSDRRKASDG